MAGSSSMTSSFSISVWMPEYFPRYNLLLHQSLQHFRFKISTLIKSLQINDKQEASGH